MLTVAASVIFTDAALAQAPPPPQQPLAPTREEVTRLDPQSVQPPQSRLEVEGGIERAPCALDALSSGRADGW